MCIRDRIGIGHTRWATHGEPSYTNAHPHLDGKADVAIVHNGIIENYHRLKEFLQEKGVEFASETDTEVVAQLLGHYYEGDMLAAIYKVLPMLVGSFALGIMCKDQPDTIYCLRKDSPLIVGVSAQGQFIASDVPAILEYTRDVYYLENLEVGVLTPHSVAFYDEYGQQIEKELHHVEWNMEAAQKGGYEHFMIKEIHEQPQVLESTFRHYVDDKEQIKAAEMPFTREQAQGLRQLGVIACGTAYPVSYTHLGCVSVY